MHCWFHTDLNYPFSSATPFALAASEISSTQHWFLDTMHPYIFHLISIDRNNQNLTIGNNKFLLEEANDSQLHPPDKDLHTNEVLFQGLSHNGLYTIKLASQPPLESAFTSTTVLSRICGTVDWSILIMLQLLLSKNNNPFYLCLLLLYLVILVIKQRDMVFLSLFLVLLHINLFNYLHSDVCGPSPISSINDYHYYVLFIDNFSCYTWLFPMRNKFETFIKIH